MNTVGPTNNDIPHAPRRFDLFRQLHHREPGIGPAIDFSSGRNAGVPGVPQNSVKITSIVMLAFTLLLSPLCLAGDQQEEQFTRISPEGLADSQNLWGYSQVIVTTPGSRTVYVAGTTGDDENGNIVHPDDFEGQVERTFQNIEKSLASVDAKGTDVVRIRLYVVNLDPEKHWPVIGSAMARYLGEQGPTATLVGIQALADPTILFEADATAVIP